MKFPRVSLPKMHGARNAFWLIDERLGPSTDYPVFARTVCSDPATSADGVLVFSEAPGFAARMRVINADGSEAEMCGNGMRCAARYLAERGAGDRFSVSSLAGPIACEIRERTGEWAIAIDLGVPRAPRGERDLSLELDGEVLRYSFVSFGNPHAVFFVDDVKSIDVADRGSRIERMTEFPDGVNVHFAQIVNARSLRVRHWERGVGITQACGTGAAASAVAAVWRHGLATPVSVEVPGGLLRVEWERGDSARLVGPAEYLESHTFDLPVLL